MPWPKVLFGRAVPATPPQVCVLVLGVAVRLIASSVAGILPMSSGFADQSRATKPATCGPAMDVPLQPNSA